MAKRTRTTRREKTGHADSPRQDNQRPGHADHADAGGQESGNARSARTQRATGARPGAAPPVPGQAKVDPPLPRGGRQPERPGQDGRAEDRIGSRDLDTMGLADAESGVRTAKPRSRRR
jgi:hypothetical protein